MTKARAIALKCAAGRVQLAIVAGSELLQPLAMAVIGGLAFALILSLVVTPTVYALTKKS